MELTYEHLGRAIKITIPLAEMGSPESFNFRAEAHVVTWGGPQLSDTVPDAGWAEVSFA